MWAKWTDYENSVAVLVEISLNLSAEFGLSEAKLAKVLKHCNIVIKKKISSEMIKVSFQTAQTSLGVTHRQHVCSFSIWTNTKVLLVLSLVCAKRCNFGHSELFF